MNRITKLAAVSVLGTVLSIWLLISAQAQDGNDVEPSSVLPPVSSGYYMWVSDIAISLAHPPPHGYQAKVVVTMVSDDGPVAEALVVVIYDGDTTGTLSGFTDSSGEVVFLSEPVFGSWTGWEFCVWDVFGDWNVYNESLNVETCDRIVDDGDPTPPPPKTPTMAPCATPDTETPAPTVTGTPSPIPPATATATPSPTSTETATASLSPTSTNTDPPPTPVDTATPLPSATSTPGGRPTRTPTPVAPSATPGGNQAHIGDLDGSSLPNGDNRWDAAVEITVLDQNGQPVANATVSGSWSGGVTGSGVCVTDELGKCSISRLLIRNTTSSVTFTVTNVSAAGYAYNPGANTDPDGDSNGTVIVVNKP